jgi:hypothetical protein
MVRPRHPKKAVEAAVAFAEGRGWRWRKGEGHCWGRLKCIRADRSGCQVSVYSTPRNAEDHARAIVRRVNQCFHGEKEIDDEHV